MKKALLGSVLALTVASFGASAADMISRMKRTTSSLNTLVMYL